MNPQTNPQANSVEQEEFVPDVIEPSLDECLPIESAFTGTDYQKHFQQQPIRFCRDILGVDLWSKQRDIMCSVREHRNTGVCSCNGSGKTFTLACCILWYMVAYYPAVVLTISPTFKQTKEQLFGEVKHLYHNSKIDIGGRMGDVRLSFSPISFALGMAIGEGGSRMENIQGFHAKTGNILIILDEASALQPQVFQAVRGSLNTKGARLLLTSNPTRNEGDFYDAMRSPRYNKIRISIHDIPNYKKRKEVIKGLSGVDFEKDIAEQYGRESDEYAVRVLGEFGTKSVNQYIPLSLVEQCIERKKPIEIPNQAHLQPLKDRLDGTRIGVDVARFGTDKTVIFDRRGLTGEVVKEYPTNDITTVAGYIINLLRQEEYDEDTTVYIDEIGVGAGLVDVLKDNDEVADKIVGVNVGKEANNKEHYANIRAESTKIVKDWMEYGTLKGDKKFFEASKFQYKYDARGRLVIESKDDMRKRLGSGSSPDYFDALMLTFCERVQEGYRVPLQNINTFEYD